MNDTNINHNNFNRQLLKLSIPIIIQNLLSAAVSSCDVVMLNYVGQSSISAVSLAANYSNVLFMVYYGVGTGASLLCAQYFGKKDLKAIHIIEGIALLFSLVISLLVALIAFTMPDKMMQIFTSDPELIRIGASYLRIMGITYLCWSITEVYLSKLFKEGTGQNFSKYVENLRLEQAKLLLSKGVLVNEVAQQVGYNSPQVFRRAWKRHYGTTPTEFKE